MRIVCNLPNAGDVINGVAFVPLKIGDETVRVSEEVNSAVAKSTFLLIPGYAKFEGDVKEVDKALESFRVAHVEEVMEPTNELRRTITELQDSNLKLSEALTKSNAENQELREENAKLKADLGQPNISWTKAQLIKFADENAITVTNNMNKEEILDLIQSTGAKRGEPASPNAPDKEETEQKPEDKKDGKSGDPK
jgi:regulator of replication initiation timing